MAEAPPPMAATAGEEDTFRGSGFRVSPWDVLSL